MFASLVYEVLDSIDIVLAPFIPCVIVHASLHLVYLLEWRISSSFVQSHHMGRRHYLITHAYYEEHGQSDVRDAVDARPVYALDYVLKVGEQREYVIDHLRYRAESVLQDQAAYLLLLFLCELDGDCSS